MKRYLTKKLWSITAPVTLPGRLRSLSHSYRGILFLLGGAVVLLSKLGDKPGNGASYFPPARRVYMKTADEKMALVYPIIYGDLSLYGLGKMFRECLNPLP